MRNFNFSTLMGCFLLCNVLHAQVQFSESTFQEVVANAKNQDKLVMVDAYTDWCGWCKVMDRETFSDSLVGEFMNDKFVSTKVNMEVGFGLDLAMKYRVSFYPQYLFFNGNGELVYRLGGFMEAAPWVDSLANVLDPAKHMTPLPDAMNFTMDYPEFYRNSYKKRKERSYPTAEEVSAFLDTRTDLTDEVSWGVISRFITEGKYAESVITNQKVLTQKYGRSEVIDKLSSFVFADVKTAIKDSSEAELIDALDKADELLGTESPAYKLRYRLYFFQMTQDWEMYAAIGDELANDKYNYDGNSVNQIAWNLYQNTTDLALIKMAASWMEDLTEKEPNYAYLDTYAALLYKSEQYSKAKTIAEHAIQKAKEEDQNPKETEALLEKINAAI